MDCGQAVMVRDFYGATRARFIAQCGGCFLQISHGMDPRNGFMLVDWRAVLRELVAMTVPAKLLEHILSVESTGGGSYVSFQLTYPLSVSGLARLLGADPDEVRGQLADMAVPLDEM